VPSASASSSSAADVGLSKVATHILTVSSGSHRISASHRRMERQWEAHTSAH